MGVCVISWVDLERVCHDHVCASKRDLRSVSHHFHLLRTSTMASSASDLCTQWLELDDHDITSETVNKCLLPITDDLWVTAACVDRLVEDVEAEQSLIDLGLKRTEQAVKRAKLFLTHALVPEEDEEGSERLMAG